MTKLAEVSLPKGCSFISDSGAVKKDDLALVPISIRRIDEVQDGQFGPYAVADYQVDDSYTGTEVPRLGGVFVEGNIMVMLQTHFSQSPKEPIEGAMFAKNVVKKSSGKKHRGWQLIPSDAEVSYNSKGDVLWDDATAPATAGAR